MTTPEEMVAELDRRSLREGMSMRAYAEYLHELAAAIEERAFLAEAEADQQ